MRFTATITNKTGKGSERRPVLPNGTVRMDDGEVFRVFFENDFDVGGMVKFVYDGNPDNVYSEEMGPGEIYCHPRHFVYERSPIGEGRLIEVKFQRERVDGEEEDPEPVETQFMLVNNDYFENGVAVTYGHTEADGLVVKGQQNDRANDPNRHTWATPPGDAPSYDPTEFDIHPPPRC